jgi:hypothetical protein
VEEGPIPAVDGVVRWRACDLIMRLYEEFGISGCGLARKTSSPIVGPGPLLLRLEHAHRSALEDHVHRAPRLGERGLLNVRIGISHLKYLLNRCAAPSE